MTDQPLEEPLHIGGIAIDTIIGIHLRNCDQCRTAQQNGPVGLGAHSAHCGTYWQLQLDRANYEGRVNNVVAVTEHGDEAPKRGRLE